MRKEMMEGWKNKYPGNVSDSNGKSRVCFSLH